MVRIPHKLAEKGYYYMEDKLFHNIMPLKKRIKKDKDCVGLFSGVPGVGKSTIAQQVLYPLDTSITINSIKWTYEDVVNWSIGLFQKGKSKGKGYIHDEAREVASASRQYDIKTKKFMDFIYENRQMNMYQWLLNGDFFDFPKSIVMERAMFFIYVKEEGEFDNGFFNFYNRRDMKKLYLKGKKDRDMNAKKCPYTFRGRFPKFYTVNEEEYRNQKKKHLLNINRYLVADKHKKLEATQILYWIFDNNPHHKPVDVINSLGISNKHYYVTRKKHTEEYPSTSTSLPSKEET